MSEQEEHKMIESPAQPTQDQTEQLATISELYLGKNEKEVARLLLAMGWRIEVDIDRSDESIVKEYEITESVGPLELTLKDNNSSVTFANHLIKTELICHDGSGYPDQEEGFIEIFHIHQSLDASAVADEMWRIQQDETELAEIAQDNDSLVKWLTAADSNFYSASGVLSSLKSANLPVPDWYKSTPKYMDYAEHQRSLVEAEVNAPFGPRRVQELLERIEKHYRKLERASEGEEIREKYQKIKKFAFFWKTMVNRNLSQIDRDYNMKSFGKEYSLADEALLTLNLKKGLAAVQADNSLQIPWHQGKSLDQWHSEQPDAFRAMNMYLYSTEFNDARDLLRFVMETQWPNLAAYGSGWWAHLEVFATQELLPRLEGENSRQARERHLRESTVPHAEFLGLNTEDKSEYLATLQGRTVAELLEIEMIVSSFDPKALQAVGKGGWSKTARTKQLYWIREQRWSQMENAHALAQLVVPSDSLLELLQ